MSEERIVARLWVADYNVSGSYTGDQYDVLKFCASFDGAIDALLNSANEELDYDSGDEDDKSGWNDLIALLLNAKKAGPRGNRFQTMVSPTGYIFYAERVELTLFQIEEAIDDANLTIRDAIIAARQG